MRKKRVVSLRNRVILPVTLALVIQVIFLVLFYRYGGVMSTLEHNAVQIFSETAKHSQLNMERDLMTYWMSSIRDTDDVPRLVEEILREQGRTPDDIARDPELNSQIISGVTKRLIDILHYSYGNGIYLVLNGPASVHGEPSEKAGIFVRDMDASNYELDRSDLLLECGLPSIAREYGITLDSFWDLGFNLDRMETVDFYQKPFSSASGQHVPDYNAGFCAYLDLLQMPGQPTANLSYSIPLILSDGSVVGVLGGEISASRIQQLLEDEFDRNDGDVLTLLARDNGGEPRISPVIIGSARYQSTFDGMEPLSYQKSDWESVNLVRDRGGNTWYAAMEPLTVYDDKSPFSDESWLVVRLTQEKDLFADINVVYTILQLSVLFSLLLGIAILLLASRIVMRPIRRLMGEMQQIDFLHRPYLNRIHVREIDELVDAVNQLSAGMRKHAYKTAWILDVLDMEIGVFEYEPGSNEVFCSHALLKLLRAPTGNEMYQFVSEETFLNLTAGLRDPEEDEDGKTYQIQSDGETRYLRMKLMETETKEMVGVLMDITMEVNARKRLEEERDGDQLTGLYNRRAFQDRVKPLLASREVSLAAFVMWDMDNLKYVNDTYGHEAGDRYITMFAEHLRSLEQKGAIVVRRSGDEFMAVLYGGDKPELLHRIHSFMEQLKQIKMETPDGGEIPLRASAGVSWYPEHGTEFEALVRYADFAMYMSKHSYKGIVQEFDMATYQTNSYLLSGREELNQLLESGDVRFAMQPIVARDGRIYGYEMLMRPTLKKLKNISEVLHLAKIQAKLPQFEDLTWSKALEWVSAREPQLEENAKFFINSISNMRMEDAVVSRLEEKYSALLKRVALELTETEEMDATCLESKTAAIRRWGGLLALDDYGAGYSNDSTLLQIEPDLVKMDLTLVRGIHANPNQQAIAKHLVTYSHQRNILVVAEGVETEEELAYLMEIQVDLFQGYYLARPSIELQPLDDAVVRKMRELSR